MYNFGISMDEYNNLLKEQNGVCFICQRPPKNRALNVDHKHEKNESKRAASNKRLSIRGLLCYSCNKGLSYFKDNPSLLEQAAKYLKRGFRFK